MALRGLLETPTKLSRKQLSRIEKRMWSSPAGPGSDSFDADSDIVKEPIPVPVEDSEYFPLLVFLFYFI